MTDIKTKILVVEDEESIRRFIILNLSAVGYEVGEADTGEKALAMSSSFRPDVMVLDLMLPGISGFEVCRRVREMRPETFIIMLTAKSQVYIYKTVWIAADDKILRPVLSGKDIFFPRRSGFWELQVKSGTSQEKAELWAQNVAIKDALEDKVSAKTASLSTQSIVVDYIGNDYVTKPPANCISLGLAANN